MPRLPDSFLTGNRLYHPACASAGKDQLPFAEANRAIAEQFPEAFNRGDLDRAAGFFAEDCANYGRAGVARC